MMLRNSMRVLLLLLTVYMNSAYSFNRGRTTEKPEVMPGSGSVSTRHQKPPTHISEFTDPHTGLNPFLDLEEGPTSVGRNVMEDERRDDFSSFDYGLVEGDATDRRWQIPDFKESLEKPSIRWPSLEDSKVDRHIPTAPSIPQMPPTKKEYIVTSTEDESILHAVVEDQEIRPKIMKEEKGTHGISEDTVIYASATTAVVATVALLVGACWWRRKLKLSRSPAIAVHGEVKS